MARQVNTILALRDRMSQPLLRIRNNVDSVNRQTRMAQNTINRWSNNSVKAIDNVIKKTAKMGALALGAGITAGTAKLIQQTDVYSSIQARLSNINDGSQTLAQLNNKIYKSALNARTGYTEMADVITRFGANAKDAFSSNDEMISFTNTLNKAFKVSGASAQDTESAVLQLSQALGAGALQGDELRSIMESAPIIGQLIAKEMGVSVGEIKKLGSEGKITSDIIKKALLNSSEEIDKKFKKMPITFGETVTLMKNRLTKQLQPTMQKISDWLNTPKMQDSIDKLIKAIEASVPKVIKLVSKIFNMIKNIFGFVKKYKEIIIFVLSFVGALYTVIKVIAILKTVLTVLNIVFMVLNGTLLLCPITWIILAIAGLIALGVTLYRHWDTVKAKAIELWEGMKSTFSGIKEAIIGAFTSAKESIKEFFSWIGNKLGGLNKKIEGIPVLGTLFKGFKTAVKYSPIGLGVSAVKGMKQFAKGGIATQPSIFGDAGAEMAIPLKQNNPRSKQLLKQADKIVNGGNGNSGNGDIHIYIDTFIGEEGFVDTIGERIAKKINLAKANMA